MAEEQSSHRRKMEREIVDSSVMQSKRGQIFGFILAILVIVIITYCAFLGESLVASILSGVALVGLATLFVTGKLQKSKKSDEKAITKED